MASVKPQFGLIGLAVMGENLALNIESKGFPLAVYNRTTEKTIAFAEGRAKSKKIVPTKSLEEFVQAIQRPRTIILMVQAGKPVDEVIAQLKPLLEKDDLIIDGGNSHYKDTERRAAELEKAGILYMGSGVSGGESGALLGPSLMPGGPEVAYRRVEPMLTRIAAQVDDGPCCTYIGPRGAGHYVKMMHNGIEYGDMQLIAETYDLMSTLLGMPAPEIAEVFDRWNKGVLSSYLIEITAKCLAYKDELTGKPLVDLILDEAQQKGTGKWASQDSFDIGMAIPTITSAVEARIISALKAERVAASKVLRGPATVSKPDKARFVAALEDALYCSKVGSYAQGLSMLRVASEEYGYNLNLAEIARIWKGGCIIRAKLLDTIKQAFQKQPGLKSLLLDPHFSSEIDRRQANWRHVIQTAVASGIPCIGMSVSLAYYDSYRRERLPANLVQAQRDFFGAHTYKRLDRDGSFHTEWEKGR